MSELAEIKNQMTPRKIYENEKSEASDKLKPSKVQQTPPQFLDSDQYSQPDEDSPPASDSKIHPVSKNKSETSLSDQEEQKEE